jgi:hypothetical protein
MKFKLSTFNGKTIWQNNKPFIWFLLSLLLIHSVLKIIFYQYNHQLLFTGAGTTGIEKLHLVKWSLAEDMFVLLGINSFLLFTLTAGRLVSPRFSTWLIMPGFVLINSFAVILNLADVFYYRFHFQRANADLLYVLDHPLDRLLQQNFFVILIFFITLAVTIYLVWVLHKKLLAAFLTKKYCGHITAVLFIIFSFFFCQSNQTVGHICTYLPHDRVKK